MTTATGLSGSTVSGITAVLRRFPQVQQAMLFGSRAKGAHKPGSDIDLALVGEGLTWRTLGQIEDQLDDLLLPYRFSLIIYNENTDPAVAAHIKRVGCSLYQKEAALV
jgi:predicted nucleotidyltransferase